MQSKSNYNAHITWFYMTYTKQLYRHNIKHISIDTKFFYWRQLFVANFSRPSKLYSFNNYRGVVWEGGKHKNVKGVI